MFFTKEDSYRLKDLQREIYFIRNNCRYPVEELSSIYEKLHHILQKIENEKQFISERFLDLESKIEKIQKKSSNT